MSRQNVVWGFLDPYWDQNKAHPSTGYWRPTVSAVENPAFPVARFELLVQPEHDALAEEIIAAIAEISPDTQVQLHRHSYRDLWDFEEVYAYLHDLVADYHFAPESEDYFFHMSTGTHVMRICAFLLVESNFLPARILQTYPFSAYAEKQPGGTRIIDLNLAKYDLLAKRFAVRREIGTSFLKSGIATRNAAFNQMIDEIEAVAIASRDPILLMGPTGAGKSLLAERIAELKRQRFLCQGAFVPVNCATLRGDGAMSALFGHRKGAFTGAASDRQGLLKRAHGGVLFLDEIGDLGSEEQAMLLRAVETGRYYPLGADQEEESRFQLIAGTNRRLKEEAAKARFREDLLARINMWTYHLPGLSERREDIEPNLEHELQAFVRRQGRQVSFNQEARRIYLDFACSPAARWTGNFRDLAASVNRMATLAPGGRINEDIVERELRRLQADWETSADSTTDVLSELLGAEMLAQIDRFDQVQLREVIRVCRASHNLSEAGRHLFQASRSHRVSVNDADRLRKYLAKFGLDWNAITEEGENSRKA